MSNEEHFRKLERMYLSAPINQYFEPAIRISEGQAEVVMPVRPGFFHAAGAAHGAVYFKALDDAAFFAVSSLLENVFALTVTFNVYFIRPIAGGEMRAVGKVVFRSQRLFVAESQVFNSDGKEVARGSGTFMPSKIPLTPELGYR